VLQKIDESLRDRGIVGEDGWQRWRNLPLVGELALVEMHPVGLEHLADHGGQVSLLERIGPSSRLDARELEHVRDQVAEADALARDDLEVLAALRGIAQPLEEHRLAAEPYERERRLELMRDVGDELGLHAREQELAPDAAIEEEETRKDDEARRGDRDRGEHERSARLADPLEPLRARNADPEEMKVARERGKRDVGAGVLSITREEVEGERSSRRRSRPQPRAKVVLELLDIELEADRERTWLR